MSSIVGLDTLKFMSFNIKGFKPRNYDYFFDLYNKFDIFLLQETWLYKFKENIALRVLPDSCCRSISAMSDDEVGRQGRPYGGLMVVWNRSLTVPICQVETFNDHVCAVTLSSNSNNLLIINIYMPVDDGSLNSFNIFNDVLSEISRLIQQFSDFKVIIGGDFNIDLTSNSYSKNKE